MTRGESSVGIVRFDETTWARLATLAERQGVRIEHLIEAAAQRLVTGTSTVPGIEGRSGLAVSRIKHKKSVCAQIVALRRRGNTIRAIAAETGYSKSYVSKILCDAGERSWFRVDAPASQAAAPDDERSARA